MKGCAWHREAEAHRLRPSDWPRGSAVVSLIGHVPVWQWLVWGGPMWPDYGETVGTLEDAKREAVEHARRVVVIKGEGEVMT